jgi:hypothetical protein
MRRLAIFVVLVGCKPSSAPADLPAPADEQAGVHERTPEEIAAVQLPECEALAEHWSGCTRTLPPRDREQVLRDIQTSLAGWREDAFVEEARLMIEEVCHDKLLSMGGRCLSDEEVAEAERAGAEAALAEAGDLPDITDEEILASPVGVAECDTYIADYLQCVRDKLPLEIQVQARHALKAGVEAWRELAQAPDEVDTLAQACTDARDAVAEPCGFPPGVRTD